MRNVLGSLLAFGRAVNGRRLIARVAAATFAFAATATFCTPLNAQVTFGSIIGTVSDPSGATVTGATVKLTNSGTSETRSVQTDSG
ncbi:MAG TPA: carboxypeptidase-like regulatory domain-containing protein, partial [Verrucomicrobiae bacterium]|nr:carboxypeptidase-like regulatory domain-containing protein [Verrucomicrobiae bacterium]